MKRCAGASNASPAGKVPSGSIDGSRASIPPPRHASSRETLTDHFADTASPLSEYQVTAIALQIPAEQTAERVARRVHAQFEAGLLDEIRGLLARGVPVTALPFTGLVYRQAIEHLRGVRDEAATRELIIRENRKYSRRQLIWFRKEPNLRWIHAAGERQDTQDTVAAFLCDLERGAHS
jgi:tRNA A37 N6-isopentenylltransferase MiaA